MPGGSHAPLRGFGREATAEEAAAVVDSGFEGSGGAQRRRRGVSVGGPAAVGSRNDGSNEFSDRHCGTAATHTPRLQRASKEHEDASADDTGSEAGDIDTGDSDEARPLSLLERIAAAEASEQTPAADAGASLLSADEPASSDSDVLHSTERGCVAAIAAGLGEVKCAALNPALSPYAPLEPAAELLSEQSWSVHAAQEWAGGQGYSEHREAAMTHASVLHDGSVRQRQARRSPTRGGPHATETSPSEDATQLRPPSAAGLSISGVVAATATAPGVPQPDTASATVEPSAPSEGSDQQGSSEPPGRHADDQVCDPAAPDTPPSKPPPLAASASAVDEAEEQARHKQQASC